MIDPRLLLRATAVAVCLATSAICQEQGAEPTPIDDAVLDLIDRKTIAGGITLVEHDGEIVHFSAHGEAAPGVPMKKDAIFRIYSMTKPITAVAALILVDEKKLSLDDSVAKHLPDLTDVRLENGEKPTRAMTVRDLCCHTSGLIYGWGADKVSRRYQKANVLGQRDLDAMVDRLADLPLAFEPGSKWRYGVSTDVLGAVVEAVSGQPLDEFFAERIFEPLGMKDTGFHVETEQLPRLTANYNAQLEVRDDPKTSRYREKPGLFSGGGGLVSTTQDYLAFCRMLLRGGKPILRKETVAEMTRNHLPKKLVPIRVGVPFPDTGFGLGVSVRVKADQPGSLGEYGWAGAASTQFCIAPEKKLIIITMTQRMPTTPFHFFAVRPHAYDLAK